MAREMEFTDFKTAMQARYEQDFVDKLTADPKIGVDDPEARRRFHWLVNALYKNRIQGISKGYGFFYEGGDGKRPGRQDLVESFHQEVQAFTQSYGDISAKGKTLLWSGIHVGRFAANDSAIRARVGIAGKAQVLNDTAIGKLYDTLEIINHPEEAMGLTWDISQNLWNTVSKSFAQNAKGDVHVFIPSSIGALSVFWNVELPELRRRMAPYTDQPKVSSIQLHHLTDEALTEVNGIQNDTTLSDAEKATRKKALMLRNDVWRNIHLDKATIEVPRESLPQKLERMPDEPRLALITEMLVESNEKAKTITLEQLRKLGRRWRDARLGHRQNLREQLREVQSEMEDDRPIALQTSRDGLQQAESTLAGAATEEQPAQANKKRYRNEILYGRFDNRVNRFIDLDGFRQRYTWYKAAVANENLPKDIPSEQLDAYLRRQERAVRAVADMSERRFFPGLQNHNAFGEGPWLVGLSDQQQADIRWLEREGEMAWLDEQLNLLKPRRSEGEYSYDDYLAGLAINKDTNLRDKFRAFARNNTSEVDEVTFFNGLDEEQQTAIRALERNLRDQLGDEGLVTFLDDLDSAADDATRETLLETKRDGLYGTFARHKRFADEVALRRLKRFQEARADNPDADEIARLDALEAELESTLGSQRIDEIRARVSDEAALDKNRDTLFKLESPLQKRPVRRRISGLFFDQEAIKRVTDASQRARDTLLPLGRADTDEQREYLNLLDKERDYPDQLTDTEKTRLSEIKKLAQKRQLGLNLTRTFPDFDLLDENKALVDIAAKDNPTPTEKQQLEAFFVRYAREKKARGDKPLSEKERNQVLDRLKTYKDYRQAYDLAMADDPSAESDPAVAKRLELMNSSPDTALQLRKVKTPITQRSGDRNAIDGLANFLANRGKNLDQATKDKLADALDDRLYNPFPSNDSELLTWKQRLGKLETNQVRRAKLDQVKTELALANFKSFKGMDACVEKLDNFMALDKFSSNATPDPDGTVTFDQDMKQKIYDTLGRKEYVAIFGAKSLFGTGEKKLDADGMKKLEDALARKKPAGLDEYKKYEDAVDRADAEAATAFAENRDPGPGSDDDAALLDKMDKAILRNYKKAIDHQEGIVYEEKTRFLRTDDISLLGDVKQIEAEAKKRKKEENENAVRELLDTRDSAGNLTPANEEDVARLASTLDSSDSENPSDPQEEANVAVTAKKFVKKVKDGTGSLNDLRDTTQLREDTSVDPPTPSGSRSEAGAGETQSEDEGETQQKKVPEKRKRRKRRKLRKRESWREKRDRLAKRYWERKAREEAATEAAEASSSESQQPKQKTA